MKRWTCEKFLEFPLNKINSIRSCKAAPSHNTETLRYCEPPSLCSSVQIKTLVCVIGVFQSTSLDTFIRLLWVVTSIESQSYFQIRVLSVLDPNSYYINIWAVWSDQYQIVLPTWSHCHEPVADKLVITRAIKISVTRNPIRNPSYCCKLWSALCNLGSVPQFSTPWLTLLTLLASNQFD